MKDKIAFWYKHGIWTLRMVQDAVYKGKLSVEEYREITGEEWVE